MVQPALAVVWSFLLLGETLRGGQFIGIAITLSGLLVFIVINPLHRPHEHLVVRLGPSPWDLSDELTLLDPDAAGAFQAWLHQPGADTINPAVPPTQAPGHDDSGWLYGAHLLN